jgi:hypothetical protein
MTEQSTEPPPERREESPGGGFGKMGGKREAAGGYGEMAATAEGEPPVEETDAGAYGALYAEADEATPGGYGELSKPDEAGEEPHIEN